MNVPGGRTTGKIENVPGAGNLSSFAEVDSTLGIAERASQDLGRGFVSPTQLRGQPHDLGRRGSCRDCQQQQRGAGGKDSSFAHVTSSE
jgi:hypothetical protein